MKLGIGKGKGNQSNGNAHETGAAFIKEVTPFGCDVSINFNGKDINGKSIMNLMAACIKQGSEIEIKCSGDNEEECLKAAVALVESGLGE